jgi:hypothetical protein
MIARYPGRWSNRDSARRAYNKIVAGETSGVRIQKQPTIRQKWERPRSLRAIIKAERGVKYFNVTIYWYATEQAYLEAQRSKLSNNDYQTSRSFVAYTYKLLHATDYPEVERRIVAAADDRIMVWDMVSPGKVPMELPYLVKWVPEPTTYGNPDKFVNLDESPEVIEDYEM